MCHKLGGRGACSSLEVFPIAVLSLDREVPVRRDDRVLLSFEESSVDLVAATSFASPARTKYALKPVAIILKDSEKCNPTFARDSENFLNGLSHLSPKLNVKACSTLIVSVVNPKSEGFMM